METVKDRLIKFIEYKGLNPHSFEKECGLATSFVANMRNSMQPEKMMIIAHYFPDLNFDWLMLGRGSMLYNANGSTADFGYFFDIFSRFMKNQEQYHEIMKEMVMYYERINNNK